MRFSHLTDFTSKPLLSIMALAVSSLSMQVQAQSAASAQRSIQDTQSLVPQRPLQQATAGMELIGLDSALSMDRLDQLEVKSDRLQPEIEAYFKRYMGKPVSVDNMIEFKSWLFEQAKKTGYLAYAQTEAVDLGNGGSKLVVKLVLPRINKVRVFARDETLAKRYLDAVSARFEAAFKPGSTIDVLDLEHKLDAVSFEMPLDLEVSIRAAGPDLLDLSVSVTEGAYRPGEILGGLWQINHNGLKQFGRPQILGQTMIGGAMPTAKWTVTMQKSEGIGFFRMEYDSPAPALKGRLRAGFSASESKSILGGDAAIRGQSGDINLGYDKILGNQRDIVYKGSVDWVGRHSSTVLALNRSEISRAHDQQLRLKLSLDNERLSATPVRMDLGLVLGEYTYSASPLVPEGGFVRLDFNARKQWFLSEDETWSGNARLRGQWANRNLDAQNRFSLGGASGVRAYTTVDGFGDDAALLTLEVNKRLMRGLSLGGFYDGGVVRSAKTVSPGVFDRHYSLQALGAQVNGNSGRWYYNTTLAKGVGGYKAWQANNIVSMPNNWSLNEVLSYLY
jgi:hemolysin activation/secretion protein